MRELIFGGVSCQPLEPAGNGRKLLAQQLHKLVVVQIAGRRNDHVAGRELAAVVVQDRGLIEAADRLLGAQDRLAQRMVLEEVLGEDLVHEVVGIVLVHLDLFQDDAALARDLLDVEDGMQHHVA